MPEPLDSISQQVKQQYEQFPYPPVPITQTVTALSIVESYILAQYARSHRFHSPQEKRALVAGCGTGHELHIMAAMNPEFEEVIGVDFSERSVAIANERLAHHKLNHCRAYVANLMDASTLPTGPFDFIGSYGVLHHLSTPTVGLGNLAERLTPTGMMGLMLYNKAGRWKIQQVRQGLVALGIDQLPQAAAIALVRQLFSQARPGSLMQLVGAGAANAAYYQHDANIVDNFLHPNDLPLSVGELPDFLGQAGLAFVEMADQGDAWCLAQTVNSTYTDFHQLTQALPRIEQLKVIEGLDPLRYTQNLFWCCRQEAVAPPKSFATTFEQDTWGVNPLFTRFAQLDPLPEAKLADGQAPQTLVTWPLFRNPQHQHLWSTAILDDLLAPLALEPTSGQALLASVPPDQQATLKQWLAQAEQDRVILRM